MPPSDSASNHENPLLTSPRPLPFDRMEAAHVEPAVDALIRRAQGAIDAIASTSSRTFASTFEALDEAAHELSVAVGLVGHLEAVATTPELRAAYEKVQPRVSAFYASIPLHAGLYEALSAFARSDEAKQLDSVRKRYVDKTLADFRRHGAELPPEGKARLSAIDVELGQITLKYSQHVLDATNAFEWVVTDERRVAGLPESALRAARASAEEKGLAGYRFTLQAPSYMAVVTYADDRSLRERMWRAYNTRATEGELDNRRLIERILDLRLEKARLLGFESFADFVLEDRMAKNGRTARAFLERLRARTVPFFEKENRALEAFRASIEGPNAPPMEPWDVAYYAEKERRALYDFDEELLRPYFSADAVLSGLFTLAGELYGVRFERTDAPTWAPDVSAYRVLDGSDELSLFYVDLYPRESKRDGAWMDGLVTGVRSSTRTDRHVEVLAANVTKPLPPAPALLTHREVETLFHEFGHLMHHALSKVALRSMSGCNVAWDFVELPSMIMENWTWEESILQRFARHHETGEPLPRELMDRLKRAKNYRAATAQMRQLGFGIADLDLHMVWSRANPSEREPAVEFARKIFAAFAPAPLPSDYAMVASFGHLFGSPVGYAAAYYSYKWAEVLESDAFSRFAKEGLTNPVVGGAFRSEILARGDSADPAELFRSFMGRDPDEEALFRRAGLVAT